MYTTRVALRIIERKLDQVRQKAFGTQLAIQWSTKLHSRAQFKITYTYYQTYNHSIHLKALSKDGEVSKYTIWYPTLQILPYQDSLEHRSRKYRTSLSRSLKFGGNAVRGVGVPLWEENIFHVLLSEIRSSFTRRKNCLLLVTLPTLDTVYPPTLRYNECW
jgi:hypothetical protein